MSVSRKAYTDLVSLVRKAGYLRGVDSVLQWDQQVVMPPKGSHARGEQMAVVSGLLHQFETDPKINE
jgi:Zn-dependent M32 family carboxypeptidase